MLFLTELDAQVILNLLNTANDPNQLIQLSAQNSRYKPTEG